MANEVKDATPIIFGETKKGGEVHCMEGMCWVDYGEEECKPQESSLELNTQTEK